MKNLSVTTFIHILFSVAIIILIATFMLFLSWNSDRYKIDEYKRYQFISLTFLSNLQLNPDNAKLEELYKKLQVDAISLELVKDIKTKIEESGKTIFSGGSAAGQVKVFEIVDIKYIYIQRMKYNLMLKDNKDKNYNFEIALAIGLFLLMLLLLLYIAVLKKLFPLKELDQQIEQFAKGDINTRITYKHEDEIGKIAKNFDEAIIHIKELSESKNLFMRNLMHELKTPITKGRIVIEMLDDESVKKILIRVFERMNELISELAEIERVTTQGFIPILEKTTLKAVVNRSQEMLMAEAGSVDIYIVDRVIHTDSNLLALAIKNLLDNGIKYSKDKKVLIQTIDNNIEILSKGKKLKQPFAYYIEPFSQEEKRSQGFGLGLYIVSNILIKLNRVINYKYIDGNNIFIISTKDSCVLAN